MKEIKDMTVEEVKEFVISHWADAFKKTVFDKTDDAKKIERRMFVALGKVDEIDERWAPPLWKNLGERITLTLECPDGMNFEDFVRLVEETVNEYEKEKKL